MILRSGTQRLALMIGLGFLAVRQVCILRLTTLPSHVRRNMAIGKRLSVGSCVLGLVLSMPTIAALRAEIPFKHVIVDDDGPTDIQCKAIGDINGDGFSDLVVAGT